MQENGRILSAILDKLKRQAKPGVSTMELADLAKQEFSMAEGRSAFLGYKGYPGELCVSINEEVVHGIPNSKKVIKDGDLLKIDVGLKRKGFCVDMAETLYIGEIPPVLIKRLMDVTQRALYEGIRNAYAGNTLGKISQGIQQVIEAGGLSVVRRFVGHGIGRELHEKPPVPNFGSSTEGPRLEIGMVLAIEPIATFGDPVVVIGDDGWTAVMASNELSAHYEHTVAITAQGPKILTSTCQAG